MTRFAKGDWIVLEPQPRPSKLVSDPYMMVTYDKTSGSSFEAATDNYGDRINLAHARLATEQDFHKWISFLKAEVNQAQAVLDNALKIQNEFLTKKHKLDLVD